jgi:hypothetical protein
MLGILNLRRLSVRAVLVEDLVLPARVRKQNPVRLSIALLQSALTGVGVEKVTSISGMRFSRSVSPRSPLSGRLWDDYQSAALPIALPCVLNLC